MASDKTKSFMDTAAEIAEVVLPQVNSVLAAAFSSDDETPAAQAVDPSLEATDSKPAKPRRKRAGTWLGLLLLGGIAAAAAILWKRLQSGSASDNWESSYTPPTPDLTPTDSSDAATTAAEAADSEASTQGPSA